MEYSCFFNSENNDRVYNASDFASYFADFIGNGVFYGGEALKVDAHNDMMIKVMTGRAYINGYLYRNLYEPKIVNLEPSHGSLDRIDRIVLRLDLSDKSRNIRIILKTGVPKQSPAPPDLQRDLAKWEICLANVFVAAGSNSILQQHITDTRLSSNLCGLVAAIIDQPDLTNIYNQFNDKYEQIVRHWNSWNSDAVSRYNGWLNQSKAELYSYISTDFDDWSRKLGHIKGTIFNNDGSVVEVITNIENLSELARRTTVYNKNGTVTETLTYTEPKISIVKTTEFSANGVTETFEEGI